MSLAESDYSIISNEIKQKLDDAYELRSTDINRSLEITHSVLEKCEAIPFENGIAKAKSLLGLFYLIRGEFEKSEQYSQQALKYFEATNDLKGIADTHYNIGGIYYRTNKYHQGLIELLKCLQIYRQLEDYHNQARTLKSIGTIYEYFNDLSKAVDSYEQSIEVSKKVNDLSLEANALNPLSGIYYKQGLEEKALETIDRSIHLKTITNDTRGLAFALYGRAKIHIKKKEPALALPLLEKSIGIVTEASDMLGLGMCYNKIGYAYLELDQPMKAHDYFVKALDLGGKYNIQFIRFKANFNLYQLAKKQGDMPRALDYLEKYIQQKEQVINSESYNIIKSYDALFKIEALEREAQAQKEKNEIIEKKNAELDSFFYRVSHDLKGPISSLLGLHNLVKMEVKEESSYNLFKMYHAQAIRMNDIVMGLINLTEIKNTEKLKVKIDFNKLVEECVSSCQYLTHFSSVTITKEIQPFDFQSEWAIINTILQNLIENAIKYANQGGESFVKISIQKGNEFVSIVVEDNGQGIPQHLQTNIFNMFYRANDRVQGSGLGLYIVKRAVERLNGTIDFTSTAEVGSIFRVTIPA